MRVTAFALVLAALVLAGCGSSKKAAKPNGEASKPANQVLADARAAATSASSVHVSGNIVSNGTPITLDVSIVRGKGATGSAAASGLHFGLVQIGNTVYIHGSDAFYKHFAGAAIAQLLHGRWVKGSLSQGRFRTVAPLRNIGAILAEVTSKHGKLVNKGETTYKGQQVVEIRDSSNKNKLYVAATGTPYPVAFVGSTKTKSGTVMFDGWNESVTLTAPKNAIDASQFGA